MHREICGWLVWFGSSIATLVACGETSGSGAAASGGKAGSSSNGGSNYNVGNSSPANTGGATENGGAAVDASTGGSARNVSSVGTSTSSVPTGATIAVGYHHSCAVVDGGVKCWGYDAHGQLGNNATSVHGLVPTQVLGLTTGATVVAAGYEHSCAVVDGRVQCWGFNNCGQLGNNDVSLTDSLVPVMVSGLTGVTAVTARFYHTCALVGGAAKCWGDNDCGQLGDNDTNSFYRTAPIQVLGLTSGVTAIAAGAYHTCAVVNGGAKCWGANDYGQLGNNSTIHSVVPIDVLGLSSNVTAIATGHRHSCALVAGGVKCWGFNGNALLGNNSSSDSLVPTQVLDLTSNVTAITAGSFHNCALVEGGAKCWGQNGRGKLGNNDDTGSSSSVPVQVFGLTGGVTTIVGGFEHTCSLVNGVMDCWGYNFYGQLGNNSTTDSFVPVEVQGP